jgi:Protein of unknown function (DUF3455)
MSWKINVVMATLAIAVPRAADARQINVPSNLEPPAGVAAFLTARAEGTQNYICLKSDGYTWTFWGPQATLFDDGNQQVITHFLSANPAEFGAPRATWQSSSDTSSIWAAAIQSSTDPAYVEASAIPWLLLQVKGTQPGPSGGTTLTGTLFIQRVNTSGGVAPTTGCKSSQDVGKKVLVPYTTDYVFYR